MSELQRKDYLELGVAVAVTLAYFILWSIGELPGETPPLVHVMVAASVIAIFGENALQWLDESPIAEGV